jgi:hypothetical protein
VRREAKYLPDISLPGALSYSAVFGHSYGYFVSLHSQNISFARILQILFRLPAILYKIAGNLLRNDIKSFLTPLVAALGQRPAGFAVTRFESLPALPNTTKPKLSLRFWYLVRRAGEGSTLLSSIKRKTAPVGKQELLPSAGAGYPSASRASASNLLHVVSKS